MRMIVLQEEGVSRFDLTLVGASLISRSLPSIVCWTGAGVEKKGAD